MNKVAAVFVTATLCLSTWLPTSLPTARAQDLGGALDLPMLGQSLALSASIRAQAQRDAARLRGTRRGRRSVRATPRRRALRGTTRFRTSAAVRQRNLAQFVAQVRRTSSKEASALQQSFATRDPIATIAPSLRRYNLRTDDVADATAAYLVSAWYGVRGRNDDPPIAYVSGVRQQMRDALLSLPSFVSAPDATKQQMAEAMLVQLMVTDALVTGAKGKPAQMAQVKSAIGQGARRTFQLDLTRLKLTSQGLRM